MQKYPTLQYLILKIHINLTMPSQCHPYLTLCTFALPWYIFLLLQFNWFLNFCFKAWFSLCYAISLQYQLLSQSRSTDIYNLMSDFIPIYKCLYGVPMHYFTVLDVFIEYGDILTRYTFLKNALVIFSLLLNFRPTRKGHGAAAEMSMRARV